MGAEQRNRHSALVVLLAMVFLYQADATIVNVASPAIRADLGASGAALELVISGYLVASATLIVIGARLGHLYGYGRVFVVGVTVFGLASLACGLAADPVLLIAARVVQGVGGALAFPQVLTGIQVQFPDESERTRALGWYSAALAGGAVSGQLLGGVLVSADVLGLGWRPIFLINVPITAVTLLAGLRLVPRGAASPTTRLDVGGAATLFLSVLAVVLPLTLGRQEGWPVWTWVTFVLGVVFAFGFVRIEQRRTDSGGDPLVDLRLLRRAAVRRALLPQAITTATYWGVLLTLALYLQGGLGRSALVSGLSLLPWVIAFGVPGRVLHRATPRWRPVIPVLGCLVLAAAYVGLSVTAFAGVRSEWVLLGVLAVGGLGLGTTFSSMLVRLTAVTPAGRAADVSGISATSMQVLGAVGVAAFGSLYLAQLGGPGADDAGHAFGMVTGAFAAVTLVAAGLAYRATHIRSDVARAAAS